MSPEIHRVELESAPPETLGFSNYKVEALRHWLEAISGGDGYRVAIARQGCVAAEWSQGFERSGQYRQASAVKSLYSCLLGIAIAEGKVAGLDAPVVEYYPEMMYVPDGEGPKPDRYAFPKDREITFRQLIGNVSGYMKLGEEPGKVFNYQTYGMNVLTHALAKCYGLYDTDDPGRLAGCGLLLESKIRDRIGAGWRYEYSNFKLHAEAKLGVFGNYTQIHASIDDLLRIGHLWLNWGRWEGEAILPESHLREATVTNCFIRANEPETKWKYGLGFWVNDHGRLWPDLPRDSFSASGAGGAHIWVCPSLGLVVAQNPGLWDQFDSLAARAGSMNEFLVRVVEALN